MFEDDSDDDEVSSLDAMEMPREDREEEEEDEDKVGPLQILDAAIKVRDIQDCIRCRMQ